MGRPKKSVDAKKLTHKLCKKCNLSLPIVEFASRRDQVVQSYCKICQKIVNKEYYLANKEKMIVKAECWQAENKEKANDAKRKYYNKRTNKDMPPLPTESSIEPLLETPQDT